MDSYSEIRRVRKKMSADVGHDIRALIASINQRRQQVLSRIIDPGTKAEKVESTKETEPAESVSKTAVPFR